MKILVDFHHQGLLDSLILLFEGRLGHEVFRPIGMDWFPEYWKINDIEATAQQFLGPGSIPADGTPSLNNNLSHTVNFEAFKNSRFDILIATVPQHIEPFRRLISIYQPGAKLIFQIGNAWSADADGVKNVMASALVNHVPSGVNFISYHQEFPLEVFHYGEPNKSKNIFSFVNCFNTADIFKNDWGLFKSLEKLMPDWNFKSFGGQCRDGFVSGNQAMADREREAKFIWHTKFGGDGYGHNIFNAAAVGRPLIVKREYYRGKLGEKLMIDGETCVTIDGLSAEEVKNKIEYYADPKQYAIMCLKTFDNFKTQVNFNEDAEKVKEFLKRLL